MTTWTGTERNNPDLPRAYWTRVMNVKKERNRFGIYTDFDKALSENAVAKLRFDSLPPEEQANFRARAKNARGLEENKRLIDELVGWQIGHPPYQL